MLPNLRSPVRERKHELTAYCLDDKPVCETFFFRTLGYTCDRVITVALDLNHKMGSGNYSHDKRQLAGEDVAFVKLSINKYELGISDWAPTEET